VEQGERQISGRDPPNPEITMSLEAALAENTAAMKELSLLLKEANEGRIAAVEALKGSAAGTTPTEGRRAGRPAGSKNKDQPEPPKEPETPKNEAPKEEPAAGDPEEDLKAFRSKVGQWASQPEPEKARRMEFIRAINDHLGIGKIVEAKPEDREQILGWLGQCANGETVNFSEGEDGAAEEDDGIG
jgi:hypothetical protein